jgi:hypothetical protein
MAKTTKVKSLKGAGATVSFEQCKIIDFLVGERKTKPKAMFFTFAMAMGHKSDGHKVMVKITIEGFSSKVIEPMPDPDAMAKPRGKPLVRLETECIYAVGGFEAFERGEDGRLAFPKSLVTTVVNCAFGASRGIMIAKSEGTSCAGVIPPIMSINRFLGEELQLESDHGM